MKITLDDFNRIRAEKYKQKLKSLLIKESKLKRHYLENDEVPFDRLLLRCSPTYLKLRQLMRDFHLPLVSAFSSVRFRLRSFSPMTEEIEFLAFKRELNWMLMNNLKGDELAPLFNSLRTYSCAFSHDALHAIFFRTLHPSFKNRSRGSRAEWKKYYNLVEGLVLLTELRIVNEIGSDAKPLNFIGIFYRSNGDLSFNVYDIDVFRSGLLRILWRLEGNRTYEPLPIKFKESGFPFTDIPGTGISNAFVEKTAPVWMKSVLPELPGLQKNSPLNLRLFPPNFSQCLGNKSTLVELHHWYLRLFPDKNSHGRNNDKKTF